MDDMGIEVKTGRFFVDNYSDYYRGPNENSSDIFQNALNDAAGVGGKVFFPGRPYNLMMDIEIPPHVTLGGTYESAPSHTSEYDNYWGPGHDIPLTSGGSVLFFTFGAGAPTGPPAVKLNTNSGTEGFSIFYPNQVAKTSGNPIGYPWAIKAAGTNNVRIRNIELINPFQGIYAAQSHRGTFENIVGQAISKGFRMEGGGEKNVCTNINFGASYTYATNLANYTQANAVAFEIGREDLFEMNNCFAFGHGTGIRFFQSGSEFRQSGTGANSTDGPSSPWGKLVGCSFDVCNYNIIVEAGASQPISFIGGHFTNTVGNNILTVNSSFAGKLLMSDLYMYSNAGKYATINGSGLVVIDDSVFTAQYTANPTNNFGDSSSNTGVVAVGTGQLSLDGNIWCSDQPQANYGANLTKGYYKAKMWNGAKRVTTNGNPNIIVE